MREAIWAPQFDKFLAGKFPARQLAICFTTLGLIAAVCVLAYWPTFAAIFEFWRSDYYYDTQSPLVAAVALWLCVILMPELLRGNIGLHLPMVAALAAAVVIWFLSYVATFQVGQYVAALAIPILVVGSFFGLRGLRTLGLPIALGLLVLPIWGPLTKLLQPMTVSLVELATSASGIPAFVSQHSLHLRAGTVDILEGCSGLQTLLFAIALALTVGELCAMRRTARLQLLAFCITAAIVANCVRITAIIALGHLTDMRHPWVKEHEMFGDVSFALFVFVPLSLIVWRSSTFKIFPRERFDFATEHLALPWRNIVIVAAIVLLLPSAARSWDAARTGDLEVVIETPIAATGWSRSGESLPWRPSYQGAAAEVSTTYVAPSGFEIRAYGVSYLDQSTDSELITSSPQIAPELIGPAVKAVRSLTPGSVIEATVGTAEGERWLLWYWYRVDNEDTSSASAGQWLQFVRWFGKARPSSLFALAAACENDCSKAAEQLDEFARTHTGFGHSLRALHRG